MRKNFNKNNKLLVWHDCFEKIPYDIYRNETHEWYVYTGDYFDVGPFKFCPYCGSQLDTLTNHVKSFGPLRKNL